VHTYQVDEIVIQRDFKRWLLSQTAISFLSHLPITTSSKIQFPLYVDVLLRAQTVQAPLNVIGRTILHNVSSFLAYECDDMQMANLIHGHQFLWLILAVEATIDGKPDVEARPHW